MKWNFFLAFFVLLILTLTSNAGEISYYMRSPKGLLMGDAYTTLADRQFALFYNPANLARHNKGFSMWLLNPTIQLTNALDDLDRFENFPSEPNEIVNELTGYPVHLSAGINPGFIMGQFGFTAYNANKTTINIRNNSRPILDIQSTTDKGFVTGAAIDLWEQGESHVALGFAVKYNKRKAVDESYPVFGTTMLDILDNGVDDYSDLINALDSAQGKAWGYDLGLDFFFKGSAGTLAIGVAALDILDTKFDSNRADVAVPEQPMNLTVGASWSFKSALLDYAVSFDYQNMTQEIDLERKLHFGFELGIPLIRVFAGYNAGYISYGTNIGLGILDLMVGVHSVELGVDPNRIENDRLILYLSLLDFSFDA